MTPTLSPEQRRRLAAAYRARRAHAPATPAAAPVRRMAPGESCPRCGASARHGCEHFLPAEIVPPEPTKASVPGRRTYEKRC